MSVPRNFVSSAMLDTPRDSAETGNGRARTIALASAVFLFGIAAPLLAGEETEPSPVRRALVLCGLPGDDERVTIYGEAVAKIADALVTQHGFTEREVRVRFSSEADGASVPRNLGPATRENIAADVDAIRKVEKPDDALWVIVVGHAHFDGRRSNLNLPGPDLSDAEFGKLFASLKSKEQVFFVTTSASGFFLRPLAAPGRIAISATEADQEVNETRFPLALADVLAAPSGDHDRDKDGVLTVFELYLAVVADVMRRYTDDEFIATEHAEIDDNGDGHGGEPQMTFLPPEYPEPPLPEDKKKKDKDKPTPPVEKPPPTLKPKDDGYLASKTLVDPKPATEALTP
jgi:hypothetical protein